MYTEPLQSSFLTVRDGSVTDVDSGNLDVTVYLFAGSHLRVEIIIIIICYWCYDAPQLQMARESDVADLDWLMQFYV